MGGWGFFLGGKGGVTAGEIQTWDLEVQVEKRGGVFLTTMIPLDILLYVYEYTFMCIYIYVLFWYFSCLITFSLYGC